MTEKDKEALVLKLAAWESTRKVKVYTHRGIHCS